MYQVFFRDKHVNEISDALELFHHRDDIRGLFEQIISSKNTPAGSVNVILVMN